MSASGGTGEARQNLYALLGLDGADQFDASDKEIQRQFRRRAMPLHPDQVRRRGGNEEEARKLFDELRKARDTLLDPELRAGHDKWLRVGAAAQIRRSKESKQRQQARADLEAREQRARESDAAASASSARSSEAARHARFMAPFDASRASAAKGAKEWETAVEASREDFAAAIAALDAPSGARARSGTATHESTDEPAAKRPRTSPPGSSSPPPHFAPRDPILRRLSQAGVPLPAGLGTGEDLEELLEWAGQVRG